MVCVGFFGGGGDFGGLNPFLDLFCTPARYIDFFLFCYIREFGLEKLCMVCILGILEGWFNFGAIC